MIDITNCRYRTSVKAIVRNEQGDILLCQEKDGRREVPGGGIEHGEDVFVALRREIYEETGLEVVDIDPRPLCYITSENGNPLRPFIANICYAITIKNLDFTPSDECIAIGFFNPETIKTIDVFGSARRVVEAVFTLDKK
jgi:8-oxo-dGTP diphosphatase